MSLYYLILATIAVLFVVDCALFAVAVTVIKQRWRNYRTRPLTNLRLCKVLKMGADGVLRVE